MDINEELNAQMRRQQEEREYLEFIAIFSQRHRVDLEVEYDWPVHIEDQFRAEYAEWKLLMSATDEMFESPHCPEHLIQLEIFGRGPSARWQCPVCGFVKLT